MLKLLAEASPPLPGIEAGWYTSSSDELSGPILGEILPASFYTPHRFYKRSKIPWDFLQLHTTNQFLNLTKNNTPRCHYFLS